MLSKILKMELCGIIKYILFSTCVLIHVFSLSRALVYEVSFHCNVDGLLTTMYKSLYHD